MNVVSRDSKILLGAYTYGAAFCQQRGVERRKILVRGLHLLLYACQSVRREAGESKSRDHPHLPPRSPLDFEIILTHQHASVYIHNTFRGLSSLQGYIQPNTGTYLNA
jgi:hypothetical protein